MSYETYAQFYDATQGNRQKNIQQLKILIKKYKPEAKTILELACGTGSVLKGLVDEYEMSGLDLSPKMLGIARTKVPNTKLYEGDMSNFHLSETYDVVLCVYDSVNHLEEFSSWTSLFMSTAKQLNKKGLFIFDMNTIERLKKLTQQSPFTQDFENKKWS